MPGYETPGYEKDRVRNVCKPAEGVEMRLNLCHTSGAGIHWDGRWIRWPVSVSVDDAQELTHCSILIHRWQTALRNFAVLQFIYLPHAVDVFFFKDGVPNCVATVQDWPNQFEAYKLLWLLVTVLKLFLYNKAKWLIKEVTVHEKHFYSCSFIVFVHIQNTESQDNAIRRLVLVTEYLNKEASKQARLWVCL